MLVKGLFISVISPQGGSGVSTISIALGADLLSRNLDTVLLAPGANYEYYPEFDGNNKYNLTNAYFSYSKGKSICFESDFNKSNKKPFDLFLSKLDLNYKTDLSFYGPFNNFMEIDDISNFDYGKFIFEGFKCKDIIIIDTNRIPPFKLCETLNNSDSILVIIDCRDELYVNKTEGFIKSFMKVNHKEPSLPSKKLIFVLNFGTDKDEIVIKNLFRDFSFLTDTKIFLIPRLSKIYTGKTHSPVFNGRLFRKTAIGKISDEIINLREV